MKNEQVKADDVPEKIKEFSDTEIKQRLKGNSKGDLIKIIVNLSKKIDELKEDNSKLTHFKDTQTGAFATDNMKIFNELSDDVKGEFWRIEYE